MKKKVSTKTAKSKTIFNSLNNAISNVNLDEMMTKNKLKKFREIKNDTGAKNSAHSSHTNTDNLSSR